MRRHGVRRWAALGGVLGPVTFIASWTVLGATRQGYSPVTDPISRLAAEGSPNRAVMTGGMVVLGAGLLGYAVALKTATRNRPRGTAAPIAAALAALGALVVAAFPLGSSLGDGPHAAAVVMAYTSLVATPILAAGALRAEQRAAGSASTALGVLSGVALLISVLPLPATGLFQRLGLTAGHAWFIATGLWLARDREQLTPVTGRMGLPTDLGPWSRRTGLWDDLGPVDALLDEVAVVHRYDQRGSGRSSPSQDLGATLALAYAGTHPERTSVPTKSAESAPPSPAGPRVPISQVTRLATSGRQRTLTAHETQNLAICWIRRTFEPRASGGPE